MHQRNWLVLKVLLIMCICLAFLMTGSIASADDYRVYSYFNAPGTGLVWAVGGYVEDYGVTGTWGDEIQYIYFLQRDNIGERTAYKVKVWVTNEGSAADPTSYIDIDQHPANPDLAHVGPIEPRHFEIVKSVDITPYSDDGGWGADEFYVDSTGVYLGAWPHGIHKFDQDLNHIGQIAPVAPDATQTLAYDPSRKIWFAGNYNRDIYQISDTNGNGDLMDETWQKIFTTPDYAGSHHDGMEYVGGYLWISDMTSDVIAKWKYDVGTNTWSEVDRYTYSEPAVVEGMGYGPNASFWIGGYGSRYVYELHGKISCGYPVADAGVDVPSYPPTIPVKLDGSGSYYEKCPDTEGRKIVLYEWDCDGDSVYEYSGTDPATTCAYPAVYNPDDSIDWVATAHIYTATLRVTDNTPASEGGPLTSVDTLQVHITAPPWQPVANPNGSYNAKINRDVLLDGSGSFHPAAAMYPPEHPWYDTIVSWEWDLDNDGQFDDATGDKVTWQWSTDGTYFVCLRVTDRAGASDKKCTPVLIAPGLHDVAVESVIPSKSSGIIPGEVVTINVNASNPGDFTESFDVTLTYNSTVIGTINVTGLGIGDSKNLAFSWDTSSVPEGTYTLKACADVVQGEIIVDNNCKETTVQIISNRPPDCSNANASIKEIWPPNHNMVTVLINGVTDPGNDPVNITIDKITQDEPVNETGDGNTAPDGSGVGTNSASVRAERSGKGNGRVYQISFTADDGKGGTCSGAVSVCVPHDMSPGHTCIDNGQSYDSTVKP
jgi:hypothetical protein